MAINIIPRKGTWAGMPDYNITETLFPSWKGNTSNAPVIGPESGMAGMSVDQVNKILGATTVPTTTKPPVSQNNVQRSSNNNANVGSYPADQYIGWDPKSAQADWEWKVRSGQAGRSGGNDYQSEMRALEESYNPYITALGNIGAEFESGKLQALENVGASEKTSRENIGLEEKDLLANLGLQGQNLEQGGQSAWSEAVRAYNALVQQGLSKYGMGSSAGSAIGELVGQEFLRSTGKQRQQLEQGRQQLGLETQKVKTYIKDKLGQLDTWAKDKKAEIEANFTENMGKLNMNKALAEGEKTRQKLEYLKEAVQQTRQLAADDKTFRQNLAAFAVEQVAKFSGHALTPKEIAVVYNDMMGQTIGDFSSQYGASVPMWKPTTGKKEEYDQWGNRIIT